MSTDTEDDAPDRDPWNELGELEDDVASARDFANAIALLTEDGGDRRMVAIQRLAYEIVDRCAAIESVRWFAWIALRPTGQQSAPTDKVVPIPPRAERAPRRP